MSVASTFLIIILGGFLLALLQQYLCSRPNARKRYQEASIDFARGHRKDKPRPEDFIFAIVIVVFFSVAPIARADDAPAPVEAPQVVAQPAPVEQQVFVPQVVAPTPQVAQAQAQGIQNSAEIRQFAQQTGATAIYAVNGKLFTTKAEGDAEGQRWFAEHAKIEEKKAIDGGYSVDIGGKRYGDPKAVNFMNEVADYQANETQGTRNQIASAEARFAQVQERDSKARNKWTPFGSSDNAVAVTAPSVHGFTEPTQAEAPKEVKPKKVEVPVVYKTLFSRGEDDK